MSYSYEKSTGDLVINGWETGVQASPHKGIANLSAVNTSTENGEVMCSFNRIKQSQTGTTGTLTQVNTNTISISGITLLVGQVITIVTAGTTGLSGSYYYISTGKLSATGDYGAVPNDPNNQPVITGITSGSATFILNTVMGKPEQYAVEYYKDSAGNSQNRYFILDSNDFIWCHDTKTLTNYDTPLWFYVFNVGEASGLAVLNGWLVIYSGRQPIFLSTSRLGSNASGASGALNLMSPFNHVSFVGKQGKMYTTDGNYIASLFPNTSLISGVANIQSYCEYTPGNPNSQITTVISGSYPSLGAGTTNRIPVTFFTLGTKPTAISLSSIYWVDMSPIGIPYFQVFAASTGGVAIDMVTGAVGRQFLNTFNPTNAAGRTLMTFTPQRLNLPNIEDAQCMAELGNYILIGTKSNTLYQWNQISALPQDFILLPENNVTNIITVNNMGYAFAGSKGNIYVTNGSTSSPALTVPDYVAGIAGDPQSYVEPYFTWGGAMYLRGRVYFSILDQTSTKAGNCGGVWSFIPTQNYSSMQDVGISLRQENISSYNTYSGYCPILIPSQVQSAKSPQYWSGWVSDINTPTYGIDFTDTIPADNGIIETDLIPTGTLLGKKTFSQIEYKLASPLVAGESVSISYRQNATDAWTSCGTAKTESATDISGYFTANFQNGQWLQLQITLIPIASSASSFVRLSEVRIR